MGQMERRAEAISGEFNWVDITQIIWFYVKTKGKPSETLLTLLEEQALAQTDSPKTHHLIMLFWAYATFKLRPCTELWDLLDTQTSKAALSLTCQDVCTFLWSIAHGGAAVYINPETYQRMCARTDDLADVLVSDEFAKFAVGDACECYSSVGEAGGPPVWQPGTNPILTSKHSNGHSKL